MGVRATIRLVVTALAVMVGLSAASARDIVSTSFDAASVELIGVVDRVQSTNDEIIVEVPASEGEPRSATTVTAKGAGDLHRWVVFTLHNPEPLPRDFVLTSRWSGFVGSGLIWPRYRGRQVLAIQASPGLQPSRLDEGMADAFSLRINPGETVTYIAELAGSDISNLALWQRNAYEAQSRQLSFFRGVVLGLATLTAVFVVCLFIVRLQVVFPAAALFCFAAVGFIALGFGYFPRTVPALYGIPALDGRLRAIVEMLLASGALACLYTFVDLRQRLPALGYTVLALFVASLGVAVYGWFAPAIVAGIARLTLLVTALGGLVIILFLWQRGVIRAQASLTSWVFLVLWTLIAMAAAMGWIGLEIVTPVLAWGLVLVLLTMAFTLAQFAFNQGVINSRFFEDSGRRALALAGAEQSVWDWDEQNSVLFVGAELERALGLAPGRISRGGLKAWLELIHVADRAAYVAAVEGAVRRGRGTFSQDFRLRRGDGTYRWFQLRARALPGNQGRAARCIGTLADITGRKRAEEHILFDAVHDRITGLPNRALFMDRLERAVQRARATGERSLSVIVIDLDRFKHVNDGLGHAVGDSLLLTLARRLTTHIGPQDSLARLFGDQFGIILDTRRTSVPIEEYVDQIRRAIAQPVPLRPREVFLTASVGVASMRAETERPEDLLNDAEIALYEAKRGGKDTAVFYRAAMRDQRHHLVVLEADLRRALERDEIEVVYQPITRLSDMKPVGFEALLRWRHATRGTLEPDSFLHLAEEIGVITELGSYVLNEAARQLGIWQRAFRPDDPLFMAVNLSSRELINRDLVDEVKTILNREELVPGSLKLELTESVMMENPELSVQILERLRQLNVGIACDDFGTGYSSLSHLARLPFDTIKIDRSFLESEPEEESARIILETMIALAHDLDMDVVAEGIENAEQAARIGQMGCDYGQGYYLSEPLTVRQVVDMLGSGRSLTGRWGRARRSMWKKLTGQKEEAPEETVEPPTAAPAQTAPTWRRDRDEAPSLQVHELPEPRALPEPPELEPEERAEPRPASEPSPYRTPAWPPQRVAHPEPEDIDRPAAQSQPPLSPRWTVREPSQPVKEALRSAVQPALTEKPAEKAPAASKSADAPAAEKQAEEPAVAKASPPASTRSEDAARTDAGRQEEAAAATSEKAETQKDAAPKQEVGDEGKAEQAEPRTRDAAPKGGKPEPSEDATQSGAGAETRHDKPAGSAPAPAKKETAKREESRQTSGRKRRKSGERGRKTTKDGQPAAKSSTQKPSSGGGKTPPKGSQGGSSGSGGDSEEPAKANSGETPNESSAEKSATSGTVRLPDITMVSFGEDAARKPAVDAKESVPLGRLLRRSRSDPGDDDQ